MNTSTEQGQTLAERVREEKAAGVTILALPTAIDRVISFEGSVLTFPDFAAGDELLQELVVSLLDKGTRRRDRFQLADVLDNRGAQISFQSDQLRLSFSGRVLRDDLEEVIGVVAEELREPAFDPEEFEKARARLIASYQRSPESTGYRANISLSHALYAPGHPNFGFAPEIELERLQKIDLDAVRTFCDSHVGNNSLSFAVVGDLEGLNLTRAIVEPFAGWEPAPLKGAFTLDGRLEAPGRTVEFVPDKSNADIRIGQGVALRRNDDDWMPLFLALHAFGGNFSARLMSIIRDQKGLTYGIYAGLSGVAAEFRGHWNIGATLSIDRVEEGIAAIQEELVRFAEEGLTEEEVDVTRSTVAGSFQVGLGTTAGLAANLLQNHERGSDPGYLDRFPAEVRGTSLERINETIHRYIHPESVHTTVAGTVS